MRMESVLLSATWDRELESYAMANVQSYLWEHRSEKVVELLIHRLTEDAALDRDCGDFGSVPQVRGEERSEALVSSAVAYISWSCAQDNSQHAFSPMTLLKDSVCKEGMEKGLLSAPVFADAVTAMKDWRFGQHFIKNYTLSLPDAEDQKRLMTWTTAGDLTHIIANFIRLGQPEKALLPRTYRTVVAMIRSEAADLLFLTSSRCEAAAAQAVGINVLLVRRPGQPIPHCDSDPALAPSPTIAFPTVSHFQQIAFINDPNRPAPCC